MHPMLTNKNTLKRLCHQCLLYGLSMEEDLSQLGVYTVSIIFVYLIYISSYQATLLISIELMTVELIT